MFIRIVDICVLETHYHLLSLPCIHVSYSVQLRNICSVKKLTNDLAAAIYMYCSYYTTQPGITCRFPGVKTTIRRVRFEERNLLPKSVTAILN